MTKYCLHHDDFHPIQLTSADIILRQQLENSISKYFFATCDRTVQNLLSSCRWYIISRADSITLVIECPDWITNWHVLQKLALMAKVLGKLISNAKIRVYPPVHQGMPFEMRVDELYLARE
jgi:hypothetical protein